MSLIVLLAVLLFAASGRSEPLLQLALITADLDEPVGVVSDPGDPNRLYLLERPGRVRLVDGGLAPDPVLDIRSDVVADGLEQGLLGIVLHPMFEQNRRVFLYWTDRSAHMVLAEFQASPDGTRIAGESRRDILVIDDPNPYHNGGQLLFGPDGYLYVGIGDGGLLPDGWRDGRDPASLLGKILRLDVDHESPGLAYAVPPDNPFIDVAGARPEVWSVGLRNPWRFSIDPHTDSLRIADVGQLKWEEVDRLARTEAAGANFGWNLYEGRQCFERPSCDPSGATFPLLVYSHDYGNCAVVGGFVYHGPVGRLDGQYLLGDYCSGRIWTVAADERRMVLQLDTALLITSFGEAADGSGYLTAQGGELYQVVGSE